MITEVINIINEFGAIKYIEGTISVRVQHNKLSISYVGHSTALRIDTT
jgi:hypothetical protein